MSKKKLPEEQELLVTGIAYIFASIVTGIIFILKIPTLLLDLFSSNKVNTSTNNNINPQQKKFTVHKDEEVDEYALYNYEKEEVEKNNYDPWQFEEDELEDDDYYSEDSD